MLNLIFSEIKPSISFNTWFKRGIVTLAVVLFFLAYVMWQFFAPYKNNNQGSIISIQAGTSAKQIGSELKNKNLIRNVWWFEVWVFISGKQKKFIVGDYKLPSNQNLVGVVNLLTGGTLPDNEVIIKIIEGWSVRDIATYLKTNFITSDDFIKVAGNEAWVKKNIPSELAELLNGSIPKNLEGYLFPDTYRIYKTATADDLIKKMLINFVSKFESNWKEELKKNERSVGEAITLASIVEKEVPSDNDRALVADIFWRRLKVGMALQADSTVNYITGKSLSRATFSDIKTNSFYNTYLHRGLPPGPICNPSASAIQAVVRPTPNEFWYFLTTPEGKVIYSKTFDEHLRAKRKYYR